MINLSRYLLTLAFGVAMFGAVACSNSSDSLVSSNESDGLASLDDGKKDFFTWDDLIQVFDAKADLPSCDKFDGVAQVIDEKAFFVCIGEWVQLGLSTSAYENLPECNAPMNDFCIDVADGDKILETFVCDEGMWEKGFRTESGCVKGNENSQKGIYGLSGSGMDIDAIVKTVMANTQHEYDKMLGEFEQKEKKLQEVQEQKDVLVNDVQNLQNQKESMAKELQEMQNWKENSEEKMLQILEGLEQKIEEEKEKISQYENMLSENMLFDLIKMLEVKFSHEKILFELQNQKEIVEKKLQEMQYAKSDENILKILQNIKDLELKIVDELQEMRYRIENPEEKLLKNIEDLEQKIENEIRHRNEKSEEELLKNIVCLEQWIENEIRHRNEKSEEELLKNIVDLEQKIENEIRNILQIIAGLNQMIKEEKNILEIMKIRLSNLQKKLSINEDALYKKFDAMEAALAQLNSHFVSLELVLGL